MTDCDKSSIKFHSANRPTVFKCLIAYCINLSVYFESNILNVLIVKVNRICICQFHVDVW